MPRILEDGSHMITDEEGGDTVRYENQVNLENPNDLSKPNSDGASSAISVRFDAELEIKKPNHARFGSLNRMAKSQTDGVSDPGSCASSRKKS